MYAIPEIKHLNADRDTSAVNTLIKARQSIGNPFNEAANFFGKINLAKNADTAEEIRQAYRSGLLNGEDRVNLFNRLNSKYDKNRIAEADLDTLDKTVYESIVARNREDRAKALHDIDLKSKQQTYTHNEKLHPLELRAKELSNENTAQQIKIAGNQEQRAQQDFSKKVKENAETIEANQAKKELAELVSRTGDPDAALNQQYKKQSGSNNSILIKELPTLFKGQSLQTGVPQIKGANEPSAVQKTNTLYDLMKGNIAETQGVLQALSNITGRSVSDILKDEKLKNVDAFASNLAKEAGYKDPADINDFKDTIFTTYNNLSAKYPTLDREVLLQMIARNVEPATFSQFPGIGNYLQPNINIKNIESQLDPLFTITDEQGNKKKSSLPWYRARNTAIQGEKLLEEINQIPKMLSELGTEQAIENSKNDRNFKNKLIDAQTYQQKKNAIERHYAAKIASLQDSLVRFDALRKSIDRDNLNN